MGKSMKVAVRVKQDFKEQVIKFIKRFDPEAKLYPEGNPATFWIETHLSPEDIECLKYVEHAVRAKG
jgi:hypothetical protein